MPQYTCIYNLTGIGWSLEVNNGPTELKSIMPTSSMGDLIKQLPICIVNLRAFDGRVIMIYVAGVASPGYTSSNIPPSLCTELPGYIGHYPATTAWFLGRLNS